MPRPTAMWPTASSSSASAGGLAASPDLDRPLPKQAVLPDWHHRPPWPWSHGRRACSMVLRALDVVANMGLSCKGVRAIRRRGAVCWATDAGGAVCGGCCGANTAVAGLWRDPDSRLCEMCTLSAVSAPRAKMGTLSDLRLCELATTRGVTFSYGGERHFLSRSSTCGFAARYTYTSCVIANQGRQRPRCLASGPVADREAQDGTIFGSNTPSWMERGPRTSARGTLAPTVMR